ncbi:hypothetical protein, partial [Hafnia paralvei]|uniref:hypothetical protein n=1 Tax=Hafnia paralvei TaxID=546367 RepID=UPI001F35F5DF
KIEELPFTTCGGQFQIEPHDSLLRIIRGYVVPDSLYPEIVLNTQSGRELLIRQQVSSHVLLHTG